MNGQRVRNHSCLIFFNRFFRSGQNRSRMLSGGLLLSLLWSSGISLADTSPAADTRLLFSANQAAHDLSVYQLDLRNGELHEVPGSPYTGIRGQLAQWPLCLCSQSGL